MDRSLYILLYYSTLTEINTKHCAYGTELYQVIIFEKLIIDMVNWSKFNGCPQHAKPAMRGKRGVDLPTQDPVARSGWVVSVTPRPLYRRERDPIPIVKEAEWAWGRSGQLRKISSLHRSETVHRSFFKTRTNSFVTRMKALTYFLHGAESFLRS